MKGIQQKQMGANLDNELFNTAKEKRTKKLKDEKADSIRGLQE